MICYEMNKHITKLAFLNRGAHPAKRNVNKGTVVCADKQSGEAKVDIREIKTKQLTYLDPTKGYHPAITKCLVEYTDDGESGEQTCKLCEI